MNPKDVVPQCLAAIPVLLFLGSTFSRRDGEHALAEAGFEISIPALLRRGLVHQNVYECRVTKKGLETMR